ncbi:MAG: hypothetical protein P8X95_16750 [Anaerolineales bacterium]|jgi:hypothetical protein
MNTEKAIIVVCLTLFIVIGFNAAIFLSFRRRGTRGQIDMFREAAQRVKDPWKDEDEALEELSKRVASLKEKTRKKDE